jgi:ankyrin repeat protein
MPGRSLPSRPSLQFDRKAAKRLLDDAQSGSGDALSRFVEFHPRFSAATQPAPTDIRLADAQLVVAREYGVVSWPRWKQFVEDRLLEVDQRAGAMVTAICSKQFHRGARLLEADPELATFDLFTACACGAWEMVAQQLQREPALATRQGGPLAWQPILYACFSRFLRRDPERAEGIVRIVRLLLDHGADANRHYLIEHGDGQLPQTCIYGAAGIANHIGLTQMLLQAGADAGERVGGVSANEALYHAAEFEDITCLRRLLEAGADPKEVSYCLSRALDFDNEPAALVFLEHGADATLTVAHHGDRTHLHKAVINRRSEATIQRLLEGGADPNQPDGDGRSPYRYAVGLGYPEIAALLEAHGADTTQITDEDRAQGAFEPGSAPTSGQLGLVARRGDLAMMKRMIGAGAPLNREDGFPPLHSACYAGQLEAARLLVEGGADIEQVSPFGGTALGTTIFGSTDCCHPEGGPGMLLPEEIDHGDYPGLAEFLIDCGSPLPEKIDGGSDGVQEVLRQHGVIDEQENSK